MNSVTDGFGLLASAVWSVVENWSMIICFAGAFCLVYFAWRHRPWKALTSMVALSVGILGAFA